MYRIKRLDQKPVKGRVTKPKVLLRVNVTFVLRSRTREVTVLSSANERRSLDPVTNEKLSDNKIDSSLPQVV